MKRTVSCFVVLAVLAIVPSVLRAAVLEVPEAYATVEAALAAAVKDDTVRVAPGEYMLADYAGITVPSGVTLEGTGNSPEDTVFKAYSATASDTTSASLLYVTNGIVKNLTFKGARCYDSSISIPRALKALDGAKIYNCIFTDTIINPRGYVAYISGEGTVFENSVLANTKTLGTSNSQYGRCALISDAAEMRNSYVTNNVFRSRYYSCLEVGGNVKIVGSHILGNAMLQGERVEMASPGIEITGAGAIIEDCVIAYNKGGTITVDNAQVFNQAGGLLIGAKAQIIRTVIKNNIVQQGQVAGVWIAAEALLENVLVVDNVVKSPSVATGSNIYTKYYYAGGVRNDVASTKIKNSTFANNYIENSSQTKAYYAHSAYLKNFNSDIVNSIFWCEDLEDVSKVFVYGTKVKIDSSCIQGKTAGTGCVNLEPIFIDSDGGDYQLDERSPCRNAGTATGAPTYDLLGVSRPQEEAHDIGCYEFVYVNDKKLEFKQSGDFVGPKGAEVEFEAFPNHIDEFVSHTWKVVDAEGNLIVEEVVTDSNEWKHFFAHKYTTFTVTLTTKWSDGETVTLTSILNGARNKVYVSQEGGNIAPYDTWEKAAHNIKDALDAVYGEEADAPGIVYLAPGIYTSSSGCSADGNYLVSVDKSVRLVGTGDKPDETVLDGENLRRVLSLTGKGSGAENIMIARAKPFSPAVTGSDIGFGLNMVNAGVVENCIISNTTVTLTAPCSVHEHWIFLNGGNITNSVIQRGNIQQGNQCKESGGIIKVAKGSIGSTKIYSNISNCENCGVVTVYGSNASLFDCDIYCNRDYAKEYGYCGAAVSARSGAKILSCRIFNNTNNFNRAAYLLAAGINAASYEERIFKATAGNVLIDKCVISNNVIITPIVSQTGYAFKNAAVGVLLGYKTTLRNSLIVNNFTTVNGYYHSYNIAGGVSTLSSASEAVDSTIENCTIVGNSSVTAQSKGGVYLSAGSIINSIVCNNGGQKSDRTWIDGNISLANDATASYCLTKGKDEIGDAVAGEGNIAADPLLNDDYTFGRRSPALNAGIRQEWMKGALDLSGKARVYGGRVDLGCFELEIMQGFRVIVR